MESILGIFTSNGVRLDFVSILLIFVLYRYMSDSEKREVRLNEREERAEKREKGYIEREKEYIAREKEYIERERDYIGREEKLLDAVGKSNAVLESVVERLTVLESIDVLASEMSALKDMFIHFNK